MSNNKPIRRVAIIGTGVIGASWTALFLAKGLEVIATDIAPDAETSLRRFVKAAWPALERLGLAPGASQSRLTFTADLPAAVRAADFVQENGPERIDFKKKLYRQLDELLPADVIIASSSSGLTMSEIQSACRLHPERCVIGHPFNPPHLVPLVEIVGGSKDLGSDHSSAPLNSTRVWASRPSGCARKCPGMSPIACRRRWRGRSITSSPKASSVSPTSIRRCPGGQACAGASWVTFCSTTSAAGQGGIEHFFEQFTGPMTAWWKVLGSPELTPEVQKQAHRRPACRGRLALDCRSRGTARRDPAGPARAAQQV